MLVKRANTADEYDRIMLELYIGLLWKNVEIYFLFFATAQLL